MVIVSVFIISVLNWLGKISICAAVVFPSGDIDRVVCRKLYQLIPLPRSHSVTGQVFSLLLQPPFNNGYFLCWIHSAGSVHVAPIGCTYNNVAPLGVVFRKPLCGTPVWPLPARHLVSLGHYLTL